MAHSPLRFPLMLSSAGALLLAGCAGSNFTEPTNTLPATSSMRGSVHGGQQPVSGSHVYLFEVGSTGYGSAANDIITAGTGVSSDTLGNFVTTDASGNFDLATYTCTKPANQTYLLAVGGNPGYQTAVANSAITLVASSGKCGGLSSVANAAINELSTVAMVVAAQQFIAGTTLVGATSTNKPGLVNALNSASDLVPLATGLTNSVNAAGTGAIPLSKINTLGDILAPCVNSTAATSSDCTALFTNAVPANVSGLTTPTDVFGAMLLIAKYPFNDANGRVSNLTALSTPTSPFQPSLGTAPNDYALPITFTGGGMTAPLNIVIDASGNGWITNCPSCQTPALAGTDSIVGFTPAGVLLTGTAGYTTNIHKPQGLAFDSAGYLWSTDSKVGTGNDEIVKTNVSTGASLFNFHDGTIHNPTGIAIDASNNAWVTQSTIAQSSIVQILSGGTRTKAAVTSAGFTYPEGIGIDSSGNIFAAGVYSNSILKLSSTGAVTSTAGGYTGSGLNQPLGISIDSGGHILTINNNSSAISELNGSDGSTVSGSPGYYVGISDANVIAVDGFNTWWIPDCVSCSPTAQGNLIHVDASGVLIGPEAGYKDAALINVTGGAIDGSGNVWITNTGTGSVSQYLGVAGPVVTPLVTATTTGALGTRP